MEKSRSIYILISWVKFAHPLYSRSAAHSAILFGSPCTRGSQQLKNVFSVIKKGRDHGNEVPLNIHYLIPTMLCKLIAATDNVYSNLTFAFQNGKVKFVQQYFGSYALIQVFCFCSTNITWFNSIIK